MRNFCKCFTFCIIIKPYFMYRLPAQRKFLRQSMFRTARFDNDFFFSYAKSTLRVLQSRKTQTDPVLSASVVDCILFSFDFYHCCFFFFFDLISFLLYWFQKCLFILRFIWASQRFKSVTNDNFGSFLLRFLFFNIDPSN